MTTRRILIGTIVAFVVMVAGFAVGMHFHEKRGASKAAISATPEENKSPWDNYINKTVYEISPPSLGIMVETYAVNIYPEGDITRVEIPAGGPKDLQVGQKVFLYDRIGALKDSLGEIVDIMWSPSNSDSVAVVQMNLRNNPDVSPAEIAKGKIIIGRNKNAYRLPYSALSRNEKGETFVWEVLDNNDGTSSVRYKPVKITGSNDDMFAIEITAKDTNQFILNPDGNLRDGQTVQVRRFFYRPPSQLEEARITAYVANRIQQLGLEKERLALAVNNQVQPASSCAKPPDIAQDFINKIKSISDAQKQTATSP